MRLDLDIHKRLLARDESGISLLYENYADALYGMAYRVLNNEAFAEDAIQQSFLKIWNNVAQYDESKSTLFTWMAQIVRNTAIDIRRLKSFEKEEKSISFDTTVHNTETDTQNTERIDTTRLIEGLDEKYAFVLEHLYLKGYSQSELSKEFDIPLGTIKTRVKKGIEILREKLADEKHMLWSILWPWTLILFIL